MIRVFIISLYSVFEFGDKLKTPQSLAGPALYRIRFTLILQHFAPRNQYRHPLD